MRGRYPWKVGATSFVLPDSVEANVRHLAGAVDDIQLLYFESAWQARLPHYIDMNQLAALALEHGHSYTVHLPLDLRLGATDHVVREQSVAEICRIVGECQTLSPVAYDLHLNREASQTDAEWCRLCGHSLALLRAELAEAWSRIYVENIDYDFQLVTPILKESGVGVCVDFGHVHHFGFADTGMMCRYKVGHIHLHGCADGRDHQPLSEADIPFLQRLAHEMVAHEYNGVVTLEVYKSKWLSSSLEIVDQAWSEFTIP